MAEDSPFGLSSTSQDFNSLRDESDGRGETPSAEQTLSNDDRTNVGNINNQNQNLNNTSNASVNSNTNGTLYTTGVVQSPNTGYFNYRGINGKNFEDPNYVSNQHILTVDSLIEYFRDYPSFGLSYAHFAYLKKLGVYPNNRLIIARRYPNPTKDNMFNTSTSGSSPIATVVSWMDPDESLFEISFNEKWEDATDTLVDIFKNVLENDLGLGLKPPAFMPGFQQSLQYIILDALGITNTNSDNLPQGNPNLIHETMRRKVPGDSLGGSGLESDFKIKMVCEYEQKYIGGIDPEIAYLDVISNLIRMGTSDSEFLITGAATEKFNELFDYAKKGEWKEFLGKIITEVVNGITKIVKKVEDTLVGKDGGGGEEGDFSTDTSGDGEEDQGPSFSDGLANIAEGILELGADLINGIFSKYREKIGAAIAAMSGMPNGPWHIMMGNPKNPFFTSGDMICEKVSINFGSELAYNDLPTEYTATLEFKPARNLGGNEISSKFNHGKGRIYGYSTGNTTGANSNNSTSRNNASNNANNANKSS